MEGNYCVYIHTSPEGKVYVGCTGMDPVTRWFGGKGYKSNPGFTSDIEKFGWENFKHEIVAKGLEEQAAIDLEAKLIHEHRSTDPTYGYNLRAGRGYSEEANPEYKAKVSESLSQSLKGRTISEEHRKKLSHRSTELVDDGTGTLRSKSSLSALRRHQLNDYCWVCKGTEATIINENELDTYLQNGWSRGRLPGQYLYLHKADQTIRILAKEADSYLEQGWEPGKSEKISANIRKSRQQFVWKCDGREFSTAKDLAIYLKASRSWDIAPSTITAAFRGQRFAKYPNLLDVISRKEL